MHMQTNSPSANDFLGWGGPPPALEGSDDKDDDGDVEMEELHDSTSTSLGNANGGIATAPMTPPLSTNLNGREGFGGGLSGRGRGTGTGIRRGRGRGRGRVRGRGKGMRTGRGMGRGSGKGRGSGHHIPRAPANIPQIAGGGGRRENVAKSHPTEHDKEERMRMLEKKIKASMVVRPLQTHCSFSATSSPEMFTIFHDEKDKEKMKNRNKQNKKKEKKKNKKKKKKKHKHKHKHEHKKKKKNTFTNSNETPTIRNNSPAKRPAKEPPQNASMPKRQKIGNGRHRQKFQKDREKEKEGVRGEEINAPFEEDSHGSITPVQVIQMDTFEEANDEDEDNGNEGSVEEPSRLSDASLGSPQLPPTKPLYVYVPPEPVVHDQSPSSSFTQNSTNTNSPKPFSLQPFSSSQPTPNISLTQKEYMENEEIEEEEEEAREASVVDLSSTVIDDEEEEEEEEEETGADDDDDEGTWSSLHAHFSVEIHQKKNRQRIRGGSVGR